MSEENVSPENPESAVVQDEVKEEKEEEKEKEEKEEEKEEKEEEEGEVTREEYGEDQILEVRSVVEEYLGETEEKGWSEEGEYEGRHYYLYRPAGEAAEFPIWEGREESFASEGSEAESGEEETEEEKELRKERETLIEAVRQNLLERMFIRRKNAFLQKKLIDYYRKRRMNNVFKAEPKGLDLEKKYLNRLYAFQEFKQAQESEIDELTQSMQQFEENTDALEHALTEKLRNFLARAKEVSLNLILSKTGKRLSERKVDLLLSRQMKKNEEKGRKKLQYIKVKNAIDEKERRLKALEYFGDGLHLVDYEQMKIDYQNYTDKIEEKEDELNKITLKTNEIMVNLTQVREKALALEEDIELYEEKVYEVEKNLAKARESLTEVRTRRDFLREENVRLKAASGLLTKDSLLLDFESSIAEAKYLTKNLEKLKKLMSEKEAELNKILTPKINESINPFDFSFKILHKSKSKIL